jgi:hypothetical protein
MRSFVVWASSRRMRWTGRAVCKDKGNACIFLVEKPEGNRPLGRPRHRCEVDQILKKQGKRAHNRFSFA